MEGICLGEPRTLMSVIVTVSQRTRAGESNHERELGRILGNGHVSSALWADIEGVGDERVENLYRSRLS